MKRAFCLVLSLLTALAALAVQNALAQEKPYRIGLQRELFLDDSILESTTKTEILMHRPERKEVAMVFDKEWEGGNEGYCSVMKVDDKYLLYYRCAGLELEFPRQIACLESTDGLHWTRPNYGLCEYEGSKDNNLILSKIPNTDLGMHDFTPFEDRSPNCPAEERFKAIGVGFITEEGDKDHGLYAWKSADGIHWSLMQDAPVYTNGKFDTQNIAFWSTKENKYVLFYRVFYNNFRVVERATSDDFIHWKREGQLNFPDAKGPTAVEQFYTNQIQQYYRAPYLYLGFPARYVDNEMTKSTQLLPQWELRQERMKVFKGGERLGTATTDTILIFSRDGENFKRSLEPFVTPGPRKSGNWFYGDNYLAWNIIETPSADEDSFNELSFFSVESTNSEEPVKLRRYALRIDGFGSLHAKSEKGSAVTKPLVFSGKELSINFATSSAGKIGVEILDENGEAIPEYTLDTCDFIYGDSLDRRVSWNDNSDISKLAGKTVRLRFVMYEADIYSFKWEE